MKENIRLQFPATCRRTTI